MVNQKLSVLVHQRSVKEYLHEGEIWIEGKKDSEYVIKVHNNSPDRVLAVLGVDGVSVMDGKPASFTGPGYIISPWGQLDVPGWRLDNSSVAKFKFGSPQESYATSKGQENSVGVIGCAIFKELTAVQYFPAIFPNITYAPQDINPWHTRPYATYCSSSIEVKGMSCNASNGVASASLYVADSGPSLGTVFGQQSQHQVQTSTFTKVSETPALVLRVR